MTFVCRPRRRPPQTATAFQQPDAIDQDVRIEELAARLKVADDYEAAEILFELGRMDHPGALAPLFEAAEDKDRIARIAAIPALRTADGLSSEAADVVTRLILEIADDVEAMYILPELGRMDHPRALPHLIEATEDESRLGSVSAIGGLVTAGGESSEAGDAVTKLLSDPDPIVRYNAVTFIGQMIVKLDEAIPAVRVLLADESHATRAIAACRIEQWRATRKPVQRSALEKEQIGRLYRLATEFESREEANLRRATQFLVETVIARLPELVAGYEDDPPGGFARMERLNQVGQSAQLAVAILMEALEHPNPMKRREAVAALEGMGLLAHPAVLRLRQLANTDSSPDVRAAVQGALAALDDGGTYPIPAIARGIEFIKVEAGSFTKPAISVDQAEQILLDDQAYHSPAIEALFAYLNDPDSYNRSGAIRALAWSEVTETNRFVFAIRDRLLDVDYGVRLAAAGNLAEGGEHLVLILQDLIDWIENPILGEMIRRDLVGSLGAIGPGAADAVPALVRILGKGYDHLLRARAAQALGEIGPGASDAVPVLIRMLSFRFGISTNAAEALGKIGPSAACATPHLARLVKHENQYFSNIAVRALGDIGVASPAVVEALIDAMNDGRDVTACAMALGNLGAGAESAIPSLARIMRGQGATTRSVVPGNIAHVWEERNRRIWGRFGLGRYHAIMAIGKIGGREAVTVLDSMPPTGFPNADKAVREALALARAR